MNTQSNLDRESFQRLLANAFVVQESGIDTHLLAALAKLQGSMARGEIDVERAMAVIVDSAQSVAKATGVAIALLQGDQLVYRAGSGSAVECVGRRVTAVLRVPKNKEARDEILRVEDAESDTRIEASICRQFGARALLILPVFAADSVVGVLEVGFREAHVFQHGEVHTYRLTAALLGEAMSRGVPAKVERAVAAEPTAVEDDPTLVAPKRPVEVVPQSVTPPRTEAPTVRLPAPPKPSEKPVDRLAAQPSAAPVAWLAPPARPAAAKASSNQNNPPDAAVKNRDVRKRVAVAIGLRTRREAGRVLSLIAAQARRVPSYIAWAAAAVVILATWIVFRNLYAGPRVEPVASQRAETIEQARPKVVEIPAARNVPAPSATHAASRWVRVSKNELDYETDEVTVRYFNPAPAKRRTTADGAQVKYIGDDVTVRYFPAKPATARSPRNQIHYISEGAGESSVPPKHGAAPVPGSPGQTVDR
jgi:hypothetical protein